MRLPILRIREVFGAAKFLAGDFAFRRLPMCRVAVIADQIGQLLSNKGVGQTTDP